MMRALISGQAATAVVLGDERTYYSISLDTPEQKIQREEWEIRLLLSDASDIEQLNNVSESEIVEMLELAFEKDRALQLLLILLNRGEEAQLRLSAAECLDELLLNSSVREFIENRMYSAPLPWSADALGAIRHCSENDLQVVQGLLEVLNTDQDEILKRCAAWETLPVSLFGSLGQKRAFYSDAVRFGAFRMFATERERKSWAIVQLLSHPYFRGNPNARKIFQEWARPFKESVTNAEFEHKPTAEDFYAEVAREVQRSRRRVKPHEAFEQAEKQREAIKELLQEGKEEQALRFTGQLITNQRETSEPEHIAKSLCDLAQFSKRLGSSELQLQFAKMAVTEAPTDAWSYATMGDAYRSLADYPRALNAYHEAGAFGDERAALIGRAEVLKDVGQLSDALKILEKCIEDFPSDSVAKNARAAALTDYGMFDQALQAYDEILANEPPEVVSLNGHAQVLREMGKLEQALEEFNQIVILYPNNCVSQRSRTETLRELGRLQIARESFYELMIKFPLSAEVQVSYARVLRDLGEFDSAISNYQEVIRKHPLNPFGYIGLADTYKKLGDLPKATEAYDTVLKDFPRIRSARNGKAAILVSQEAYSEAVRLLPTELPATLSEWIAYHIRGMAYMRSGKLERAQRIFEWGLKENPWASQLQFFQTALASLRIQQRRYEESIELVRNIVHPAVEPIARVLKMHASGELGNVSDVELAYRSVRDTSAPSVISLREMLAKRYMSGAALASPQTIFYQECDSLLLAA